MFNPSQSSYGGYNDYWGGYGRPPVPPPPLPPMPHGNQAQYHGIPPPNPYRQMRSLPHSFRPPPPPPPPPERAVPPNKDSEIPFVSADEPEIAANDDNEDNNSDASDSNPSKQQEASVGTPLVPRGREGPSKSYNRGSPRKPSRKERPNSEQPSKPTGSVYKRPLPVELDPNFPSELVEKLHNNHCELCDVKLNSRIQSKTHYEGKPHAKKVKNFLIEHARKDGPSAAKMPKIEIATKKKSETLDVSQLYCKCCDLSFTSEQHAQQHYMGRNHQRVLHGLKPLKAGYYNKDTGKWQRVPPDPRVAAERLGLNLDSASDEDTNGSPKKDDAAAAAVKEKERYFCELCGVSATSKEQLDGHMVGQRHLKNVRATTKKATSTTTGLADSILASVIKADEVKKTKPKDFSIYRTPSGKYYCAPCDITLNSESQFAQHVESKKHKTRRVK